MLKIDIIESPQEIRIILYGTLYDPWTSELNRVWEEKQKDLGSRQIIIDLKETTAIDRAGVRLLTEMYHAGAKLVTSGVLTSYLVNPSTND